MHGKPQDTDKAPNEKLKEWQIDVMVPNVGAYKIPLRILTHLKKLVAADISTSDTKRSWCDHQDALQYFAQLLGDREPIVAAQLNP
jgi:hypothetical protein